MGACWLELQCWLWGCEQESVGTVVLHGLLACEFVSWCAGVVCGVLHLLSVGWCVGALHGVPARVSAALQVLGTEAATWAGAGGGAAMQ